MAKGPTSTCIGCDYLLREARTGIVQRRDYECEKEQRVIELNSYSSSPTTPKWCPFLKGGSNE